ncbi:hypothetical protein BVY00_00710 [bacterium G20]|nr:hypothetical protein BVY00_00710 [bacterium G20]
MKKHNQKGLSAKIPKEISAGFGLIEALLVILILAVASFGGYWVWHTHHKNKTSTANTTPATSSAPVNQTATSQPASNQQGYLVIKELGIRMKLTSETSDAYYVMSSHNSPSLSVHYLDNTDCKATAAVSPDTGIDKYPGIATVGTFTAGQTDPVQGDYQTSYPNAPLIDGKYYYLSLNQYDCTNQPNKLG